MPDSMERATGAGFVEAELNYVVDDGVPQVRYVDWPEEAHKAHPATYEARRVRICDGRAADEAFALATHGFVFVTYETKVRDFFDEAEVLRVYYPEIERLIRAETGAARVLVFDHTLRTADDARHAERWVRPTVHAVHNDYTERSAPQRVRDFLPADEAAAAFRDRPGVAADRRPDRVRAAGHVRRARDPGGRVHPLPTALPRPHGRNVSYRLQPGASLVVFPRYDPERGDRLQGVRHGCGRRRPLHRAYGVRRPRKPARREDPREHRDARAGILLRRDGMEPGAADPDLVARLADALEEREEVLEAYLFGSQARGRQRPESDVDVAVYVDEARAEDGRWGYRAMLTTELMTALATDDVDVVVLNRAPALLYHRVLRDGVRLLSRDSPATTTRAGWALSRYLDFLPQLDKMDAARHHATDTGRRASRRAVRPDRPDRRVVERHLAALRRAAAALRRHAGASAAALRADSDRRWAVERGLQLCARNALDVAAHLAAAGGLDPASYRSAIDGLVEAAVLPPDFGERFRGVAGLRNVLVHGYSGRRSGIGRSLPRRGPRRLRGVRTPRRTMARRSAGPVSGRGAADARTRPTGEGGGEKSCVGGCRLDIEQIWVYFCLIARRVDRSGTQERE